MGGAVGGVGGGNARESERHREEMEGREGEKWFCVPGIDAAFCGWMMSVFIQLEVNLKWLHIRTHTHTHTHTHTLLTIGEKRFRTCIQIMDRSK